MHRYLANCIWSYKRINLLEIDIIKMQFQFYQNKNLKISLGKKMFIFNYFCLVQIIYQMYIFNYTIIFVSLTNSNKLFIEIKNKLPT